MMIKGQDVSRIKLGNTLSNDQLSNDTFDYMLSNPPFGVDWKKIEGTVKDEHEFKGFDGRFGPGLPRVSDGSLLFLMHLISKFRPITSDNQNPSRIGIILNGSPLFTGGAGSGESEIRRYILEADLLEAIVALPTDMFYNTGIATNVWVLSNKKANARKGKVQLINGTRLFGKMRKSLGSKRNLMSDDDIRTITRSFGAFEVTADEKFGSKMFATHAFGYRRITVERPLRLSAQITDAAIYNLRFAPKPFNAVMRWMVEEFGDGCHETSAEIEPLVREKIKNDFKELKEKQIKELFTVSLWKRQFDLSVKARALQQENGNAEFLDFNVFEESLKAALKKTETTLDAREKKQFLEAVTTKNPDAEPVIKKILKGGSSSSMTPPHTVHPEHKEAQPLYGAFEYKNKVVEFQTDGDLRDNENIPLDPSVSTTTLIETYFNREVAPHVPDAWINADKCDEQDGEIGIVGYEIPFNRHFCVPAATDTGSD
nr:N-6 DNA methylase [Endozoicomonas sp. SESOKO1]